jgi:hypothetical protein
VKAKINANRIFVGDTEGSNPLGTHIYLNNRVILKRIKI